METMLCLAERFGLEAADAGGRPFGQGLIHDTWRLETRQGPVLLQRLNGRVFADPGAMAENAAAAAARVDHALNLRGDHDPRHRLTYHTGPDGRPWARDDRGRIWRAARFVSDSRPADPREADEVRQAARLLGRFPGLVQVDHGPRPEAILPGFHDTPARLAALHAADRAASTSRRTEGREELARIHELSSLAHRLNSAELPPRLVHNDAKLDNVLVDVATGTALCVVDLDTVMPGLAAHDFGDLVRTSVTGRPEDEGQIDRITVDMDIFANLAEGYLDGAADWLEAHERAHLLDGALVIAFEQAVRFLTDHLQGDSYYTVDDSEHNLRRTRAQLRLLDQLLDREQELRRIMI